MKRLICFFAVIMSLLLSLILPHASAITYGFVDSSNTFRNTGAFIVKSSETGEIFPICSGTLITPNVFLTAAHCTSFYTQELAPEGEVAYVSLDQSIPFGALTRRQPSLINSKYAAGATLRERETLCRSEQHGVCQTLGVGCRDCGHAPGPYV